MNRAHARPYLAVGAASLLLAACSTASNDQRKSSSSQLQPALTMAQALDYAHQAGLACDSNLVTAGAIARAESSLIPDDVGYNGPTPGCPNGSRDRGLWQINDCYHPSVSDACAFDPLCNAQAMVSISSNGTDWSPWSTYNGGEYQQYLGEAQVAYAQVCGSSQGGPSCAGLANGLYCGSDSVNGDANTLYLCTNGSASVSQVCTNGCQTMPAGQNDQCNPASSGPSCAGLQDGLYCGSDSVNGDPNTLYLCSGGSASVSQVCSNGCTTMPAGQNDVCSQSTGGGGLSCNAVQWWNSYITYGPYVNGSWWDTDLGVSSSTQVVLRHDSQLVAQGVYGWGWMPEFVDQVTGDKFRFLHLRPQDQYTTQQGAVYSAGTVVGLSGGDTPDTGYPTYSSGAHLCVQTVDTYRATFPAGQDPCN